MSNGGGGFSIVVRCRLVDVPDRGAVGDEFDCCVRSVNSLANALNQSSTGVSAFNPSTRRNDVVHLFTHVLGKRGVSVDVDYALAQDLVAPSLFVSIRLRRRRSAGRPRHAG